MTNTIKKFTSYRMLMKKNITDLDRSFKLEHVKKTIRKTVLLTQSLCVCVHAHVCI